MLGYRIDEQTEENAYLTECMIILFQPSRSAAVYLSQIAMITTRCFCFLESGLPTAIIKATSLGIGSCAAKLMSVLDIFVFHRYHVGSGW